MKRECFAALSILIAVAWTPVAPTWAQERSPFLKLPQEFQVLERKAPLDIVVATRSLTSRLQGADSPEAVDPVAWTASALAGISKEGFTYGALDLRETRIHFIGPSASGEKSGRRLIGSLSFADGAQRRARVTFLLDYSFNADRIVIREAGAALQPAGAILVRAFLVPMRAIPSDWMGAGLTHAELWRRVTGAAIDPKQPDRLPDGVQDWRLFLFVMDRLPRDDDLVPATKAPEEKMWIQADFDGWRVLEMRSAFDIQAAGLPKSELWLVPGGNHPANFRSRRVIAAIGGKFVE
jgi:hypothetical protein